MKIEGGDFIIPVMGPRRIQVEDARGFWFDPGQGAKEIIELRSVPPAGGADFSRRTKQLRLQAGVEYNPVAAGSLPLDEDGCSEALPYDQV
ncbi:MAG: hypothetical protein AB1631_01495 [Acidobacteriota bacterium]